MTADIAQVPQMLETALAHQREGRQAEAEAVYEAVLAIDGDQFAALQGLGLVLLQKGQLERSALAASSGEAYSPYAGTGGSLRSAAESGVLMHSR